MLLATYIAPGVEQALRERRLPFFETAGNCYLDDGDMLIWIEGRPKLATGPTVQRAFRPAGLRVEFILLREPRAIERTYRELAKEAGIAVGGLVPILDGLRQAGFLEDTTGKGRRLRRLPELLDRWTAGYLELLRPKLMVRTCCQAPGARLQELLERVNEHDDAGTLRIGGELGAATLTGDIRPARATLHWTPRNPTEGPGALARLLRTLHLVPEAQGPVTILRGLEGPTDDAQGAAEAARGHQAALADPLLLRAEILAGEPDDRLRDLADDVMQKHIRIRWPQ
jgi:hypothetical protein